MLNRNKVHIIAHAGCMNTSMDSIEAVEAGIKYGADVIEIDLNVDENSNLVLSHDVPKERVEYPKFKKVLEIIKDNKYIFLNVDVKNTVMLRWLKNIISEYGLLNRVFLTGLTRQDIIENKDFLRNLNYFVNLGISDIEKNEPKELINEIEKLEALGININHRLVNPDLISACKDRKMLISVWTVDNVKDMEKVISFKVNSITTKRIDVLKNIIPERC